MAIVPELDPSQVAELGGRLRDNIARAVKAFDPHLILLALPESELLRAGRAASQSDGQSRKGHSRLHWVVS